MHGWRGNIKLPPPITEFNNRNGTTLQEDHVTNVAFFFPSLPIVPPQHPRPPRRWLRCRRRPSRRPRCRRRSRGRRPGRRRKDPLLRQAHGLRRRRQAQGHQGGQEPARSLPSRLQEVCRERAQAHEGVGTKGRGREDCRDDEGVGCYCGDGVRRGSGGFGLFERMVLLYLTGRGRGEVGWVGQDQQHV